MKVTKVMLELRIKAQLWLRQHVPGDEDTIDGPADREASLIALLGETYSRGVSSEIYALISSSLERTDDEYRELHQQIADLKQEVERLRAQSAYKDEVIDQRNRMLSNLEAEKS